MCIGIVVAVVGLATIGYIAWLARFAIAEAVQRLLERLGLVASTRAAGDEAAGPQQGGWAGDELSTWQHGLKAFGRVGVGGSGASRDMPYSLKQKISEWGQACSAALRALHARPSHHCKLLQLPAAPLLCRQQAAAGTSADGASTRGAGGAARLIAQLCPALG